MLIGYQIDDRNQLLPYVRGLRGSKQGYKDKQGALQAIEEAIRRVASPNTDRP